MRRIMLRKRHKFYLKAHTTLHHFTDAVKNMVENFVSKGAMATSVIIRRVFIPRYKLLWMEKAIVRARSYIVCKSNY